MECELSRTNPSLINSMEEMQMKLLATAILSLSLLTSASAQTISIARSGSQPSRPGPAENFTGSVRVDPLFQASDPARATGALVMFERGARSAWHSHPLGQILSPDQLRSHLARARDNGLTQEQLVETITHLAFYAGWPSAMTAVTVAKEVFEDK